MQLCFMYFLLEKAQLSQQLCVRWASVRVYHFRSWMAGYFLFRGHKGSSQNRKQFPDSFNAYCCCFRSLSPWFSLNQKQHVITLGLVGVGAGG